MQEPYDYEFGEVIPCDNGDEDAHDEERPPEAHPDNVDMGFDIDTETGPEDIESE